MLDGKTVDNKRQKSVNVTDSCWRRADEPDEPIENVEKAVVASENGEMEEGKDVCSFLFFSEKSDEVWYNAIVTCM